MALLGASLEDLGLKPQQLEPSLNAAELPTLGVSRLRTAGSGRKTDSASASLAFGLTEDLIHRLSRWCFPVVSMAGEQSRGLDGQESLTPTTTYLVEGTVIRSKNRVRVSARLLRGRDRVVVWEDVQERPLDDIFLIQDRMAHVIGSHVTRRVLEIETKAIVRDLAESE